MTIKEVIKKEFNEMQILRKIEDAFPDTVSEDWAQGWNSALFWVLEQIANEEYAKKGKTK